MTFKSWSDDVDGKRAREYNALTRIPEEMCVGDLNQAVKDLREMLYELQLESQNNQCWDDDT